MDFSGHKDFRSLIDSEYGRFYEKYPYATLVLDYFIQLRAARQQEYFQKWLSESQVDNLFFESVTKLTNRSYSSKINYWYLYLASHFIDRTDSYLIHNSLSDFNFPGTSHLLRSIANNNKWAISEQWSGSYNRRSLVNLLLLKQISPYRCFIGFRTQKELTKLRHSDDSLLPFFLNNESYMKKLETLVKKDVERSKKLIAKLGIDLFINSGDASAEARVLNKACEEIPVNTLSFAHGYIQATNLLGIAPVRSSKFVVWTKEQKEDMHKVLSQEQSNRIEYIGFPKDYDSPKQDLELKYDHCLIVMTYIRPILKDKNLLDILERIILDLRKFTKFITIRLHPHERKGSRMISLEELEEIDFYINKWGLELSNSDLKTDLNSSDFVIGCSTSTLVEALAAGKRTYDIEELSRPGIEFKAEGVVRIKAGDISTIPKISNKSQKDNHLQYNKTLLSSNLTRMILQLFKQD